MPDLSPADRAIGNLIGDLAEAVAADGRRSHGGDVPFDGVLVAVWRACMAADGTPLPPGISLHIDVAYTSRAAAAMKQLTAAGVL